MQVLSFITVRGENMVTNKNNRHIFKQKSIKTKLLIPFTLLILFAGGTVALISYNFTIKMMVNELTNSSESQMKSMSETFDMFFSNTDNIIQQYTVNSLLLEYKQENHAELISRLQETKDAYASIAFIYAGDEKTGDMIDPTGDLDENYNPKERPWYQQAVKADGETIWTRPYVDEGTGKTVLTAARAYYDKQKLQGVFAVDVTINTLMDMVNQVSIGETGYAMVLDQAGHYIVHPEEEKVGQQMDETLFEKLTNTQKQGSLKYEVNDEEKVISFVTNPTTGWIIGGTVDQAEFASKAKSVIIPIVVALIIVIIIGVILSLLITNRITKPIKSVMYRMNKIAAGDLSDPPLISHSADETGQLVRASNKMGENMRHLLDEMQTASEAVRHHSEDLTQFANEVHAGTDQIAATMEELAAGSETQAHSANQLAHGMGEFDTKMKDVNEKGELTETNSKKVQNLTDEGSRRMQASKEQMDTIYHIVHEAVEKVRGLDQQSKQISELITIVHDIADQTNLLALNASIEAARAGEHGQGFAVVATEIRKLAEEVATSVTDITEIVGNIQQESMNVTTSLQTGYQEVEVGASQIQTTLETFVQINTSITQMGEHITNMSNHLRDMTASSQDMNRSIEEVASSAEQAAAGIEEISATTEETSSSMEEIVRNSEKMEKLADKLHQMMTKFTF